MTETDPIRAPWEGSRVLAGDGWQMTFGERAALEGLVSDTKPALAIEIGRAEGGSLACLAAHSGEVHSLDLEPPGGEMPANVHAHTGDSKRILPTLLAELAEAGRNVDLVLVDGDHSAAGVRADLETLLTSPALRRTLVVLHDTMNDAVRRGITEARVADAPGVVYANLDLVPGFVAGTGKFAGERWGGLGLVVVDRDGGPWREGILEDLHVDQHELLTDSRTTGPGAAQLARRAKAAALVRVRSLRDRLANRRR